MSLDSEWVELKRGNDWGYVYLAETPLDEHGHADAHRGLKLQEDQELLVRFPNSYQERVRITSHRFTGRASDMGRHNDVSYSLPGFNYDVYGLAVWICLDQVQVFRKDLST